MKNLAAPGSRLRLCVLAVLLAGTGLSAATLADWTALSTTSANLRAKGWGIYRIGSDNDSVTAASCRAISQITHVEASAFVSRLRERMFVQFGYRTVSVVLLGSDRAALWPPGMEDTSIAYYGGELSDLGASVGRLDALDGTMSVPLVGRLPPEFDVFDLGGSIVLPVRLGSLSGIEGSCIVSVDPRFNIEMQPVIQSAAAASSLKVQATTGVDPAVVQPFTDFLHRANRLAPLIAGLALALVWAMALRSRSSELAVYRITGTSRTDLLVLLGLETLGLLIIWTASGVGTLTVFTLRRSQPVFASYGYQVLGQGLFAGLGLLTSAMVALRRASDLLKDR